MTTSRLATLVAFLALGFATVFLLPRSTQQGVGIRLELPDFVGNWKGTDAEIQPREREVLGEKSGTRFVRKIYRNLDGYEITASIILSGRDMSTSIHRFERCLDAQGWAVNESDQIAVSLPQHGTFPITQVRGTQVGKTRDDKAVNVEMQACYWFVGQEDICAGHWTRWAIDNRDRLFRGISQRWAFVLLTGSVPIPTDPQKTDTARKWSQTTMREFIKMLAPKIHLDSVKYL